MADARFHRAVPHTFRAVIQQRRRVLAVIAIGIIILWGLAHLPGHDIRIRGLGSEKRKYLKWLLAQSVSPKTKIESVITDDAVAMLSEKLSTPLQFEYYLTRDLEEAYKVGQKPVGGDMINNVLAKDINGLEPRLTRQVPRMKHVIRRAEIYARSEVEAILSAPRGRLNLKSHSQRRRPTRLQVLGPFSNNVGPFSSNVVLSGPLFSINVFRK
jgi:hypothetical protein